MTYVAAVLSAALLLCEGYAARVVSCALCYLKGCPGKAEDEPCERDNGPGYEGRFLTPCGKLFWPGISPEEAGDGKPHSRSIGITAEGIAQEQGDACSTKEGQVGFETGTGYFGADESYCRNEEGDAQSPEGNGNFSERGGLESAGFAGFTGKTNGPRRKAEGGIFPGLETEVYATDVHELGKVPEQDVYEEVPQFVEKDMQPTQGEKLGADPENKEKARLRKNEAGRGVDKYLSVLVKSFHFVFNLLDAALSIAIFPFCVVSLLFVAVRSRLDWWLEGGRPGWKRIFAFFAWLFSWFLGEMFLFGAIGAAFVSFLMGQFINLLS